ncbi:hypothetical protein ABPG75_002926 [Micractinium tetrahymenae]
MAVSTLIAYRCWDLLFPAALSWLLTAYALCLLDLWWRRRWPSSHECWREGLAALLCINCFRAGAPWLLMRHFLDELCPPAGMGMHVAHLLFASGAPKMAVHLLAVRMRFSVSIIVQLAVIAASLSHNPSICAAAPLAHPQAQHLTRQVYLLVSSITSLVGPAPGPTPSSPEQQCAVLLTWLRIGIALLAPLTWQALLEARLFCQHEAQRQQAGLPPERGLHAVVYSALATLSQAGGPAHAAIVCWLLLLLSWTLSTVIALPPDASLPAPMPA